MVHAAIHPYIYTVCHVLFCTVELLHTRTWRYCIVVCTREHDSTGMYVVVHKNTAGVRRSTVGVFRAAGSKGNQTHHPERAAQEGGGTSNPRQRVGSSCDTPPPSKKNKKFPSFFCPVRLCFLFFASIKRKIHSKAKTRRAVSIYQV